MILSRSHFKLNPLLILSFLIILNQSFASDKKITLLEIKGDIEPGTWRITKKAIQAAETSKSDILFIQMNTYGGLLNIADSIRTALLETNIKSIVYIDNNAASAGALISIACNKIYMRKGASIGAASVVNQSGEILPEKYQSYMRALMRTTAERRGRNPLIAEGFVDPDLVIDSIKPKGKVLTFTTQEAIDNKYCDGAAESIAEVLKAEGISNYEIIKIEPTFVDKVIAFLINPAVSGILILLILGGIYFEIQAPGIGFALLVSAIATILYFAPLYLEGLAANWEIILFFIGLALIIVELFVIPGFGIFGISGIILMVCGLAFSMVMNNFFNFSISGSGKLMNSFSIVLAALILAIIVSVIFGKNLMKSSVFRKIVLEDEQKSDQGYSVAVSPDSITGRIGVAITDLRPAGKIELDGIRYEAVSDDGYISKGENVFITKQENVSVFVKKAI